MPRRLFSLLGALLLLPGVLAAQEAAWRDDLRFVEALRDRNQSDLALEFLQKMAKGAPADLAKELPLEFAKTRLQVARSEPESGKRLELYRQAREDFEKFLKENPGHPRSAEANVDIARVLAAQGKTEMSRALLNPDHAGKKQDAAKARATLELAGQRLAAAVTELEALKAKLPDPDSGDKQTKPKIQAQHRQLANEIAQTKLERALNYFDQSDTYLEAGSAAASKLIEEAIKGLQPLAGGPASDPVTWKATAWLGRCVYEVESAEKAQKYFTAVLASGNPPASAEGQRLARYFRMLLIQKSPNVLSDAEKKRGVPAVLQAEGERWLKEYGLYRHTPEGFGVSYLLAGVYLERANTPKLPKAEQDRLLGLARGLLRDIESSENEFTERARNLKITTMARQGAFTRKVTELKSFEDCFARAQYELFEMGQDPVAELKAKLDKLPDASTIKDAAEKKKVEAERTRLTAEIKKLDDPAAVEKARKAHVETVIEALQRGLKMPDAQKKKGSLEVNTAYSTLAYWCLQTGKLREAITAGETFAREDPRSSQAAMSAGYALQAYARLIAQRSAEKEDTREEQAAMLKLAEYMEERWPREAPGDMARVQIGMQLLREEKYAEGMKKLEAVNPTSPSYTFARYWLADAAAKAATAVEKDDPAQAAALRKQSLAALESMPEPPAGADPITNQLFYRGKAQLGRQLFPAGRYKEMEALAALAKKVNEVNFDPDRERNAAIRAQLRYELASVGLYGRYGLADAAFTKGDHAQVVAITDPLVDALNKEGDAPEKSALQKDPRLAGALLSRALQSNLQLGKIDRTDAVLDSLDRVSSGEGGDSNTTTILKRLAALIRQQVEEMRKKDNKEALAKAIKGYTELLNKRIKKQKNLTPEFILLLADCYSSMEQHDRAAEELAKIPNPKAAPGSPEEKQYRAAQFLLARELRLTGGKENLEKAGELIKEMMGEGPPAPRAKWGWGRTNLDVLKENNLLLEAKGEYLQAFNGWVPLVKQLAPKASADPRIREHYLECYFHMVLSFYKNGQTLADKEKRDKAAEDAGKQIWQLEKNWEDFGSEASRKRFTDLLAAEPGLKEQYEAAKKKGK